MKHYFAASFFGTLALGHLWRWLTEKGYLRGKWRAPHARGEERGE